VERFARAYLAAAPAEADVAAAGRLLGLSAASLRHLGAGLPLPPEEQVRLRALRDRDFRSGDVIRVEGWLFARSEARLLTAAWLGGCRTEPVA
jgi:hypothetical protein